MSDPEAGGAVQPPYLIRTVRDGVDTWSERRLPFQPSGWALTWRNELASALKSLPAAEGIRGVYTSPELQSVDPENVLFYNVGLAAFRRLTQRVLLIERRFATPPSMAADVGWVPLHHHSYRCGAKGDQFVHWRVDKALVSWDRVPLPELRSPSLNPAHVWARVMAKVVVLQAEPPRRFGLRVRVRGTGQRPISAFVKPLIDGIVSAFHGFVGTPSELLIQRLAGASGLTLDSTWERLLSSRQAILGRRALVRTTAAGLFWNPRDEDCCAVAITAEPGGSTEISGELFEVAPADDPDVALVRMEPPPRLWSDAECAQIRQGNAPKEMDDRWWVIASETTLRIHRYWTGRLIFEASIERGVEHWRIGSAWFRGTSPTADDTELLRTIIDREVLGLTR